MKKILMSLAATGLMLAGCTKNEIGGGYDVQDPGVIGFSTSTSRATVNDLTKLTGDGNGFIVYATADNAPGAWYTNVNGTNNYVYEAPNWKWAGNNAQWPTVDRAYPMNFYAMYPAAPSSVGAGTSLSSEITINAAANLQVDMLAAKAMAGGKPASGKISLTFDHILSKVNFGIIPGHDMVPEVLTVAVMNVHSKSLYNYMLKTWSGSTSTTASYDYYRQLIDPEKPELAPFTARGTDTAEETVAPIYTNETTPAAAAANLMLMPQSTATGAPAAWNPAGNNLSTNAYIEVIYRITHADDSNYIGYTKGEEYLAKYGPGNGYTWGNYIGLGDGDRLYNGALYIKVGFPVTVEWIPGKGYTYNICLGTADSTNGYYITDTYYDNTGTDTRIPIKGDDGKTVIPGDPVTSGTIGFLINVNDWVDDTTVNLQ